MRSSYPLIAVGSDERDSALTIKRKLSNGGVFASVMSFAEARAAVESIDLLIISLSRYSSPAQALTSAVAKRSPKLPIIIIGASDAFGLLFAGAPKRYAFAVFGNCVFKAVDEILPFSLFTTESKNLITHLYDEAFIVYRGVRLFFTSTEATLIHYLARAADEYASAEELSVAASLSAASVPVLINSINNKTKLSVGVPMIRAKRNHGYFLID